MYDAIVIGARCAGSPTAMLLARKGYRVLLVDKVTFPKDSVRAHFIRVPGVAYLKRWGLLERVIASNCPPISRVRIDYGHFSLNGEAPPIDGVKENIGPRRFVLDKILVDAAVEAGVEIYEDCFIEDLLSDNTGITGIRARSSSARSARLITERARIVIGADGLYSLVARVTQASVYLAYPSQSCAYYTYWSGLHIQENMVYHRPDFIFFAFPTNNKQTIVGFQTKLSNLAAIRANVAKFYMHALHMHIPELAEQLRSARQEERFLGVVDLPHYYRKPFGPGWALVGDAGCHKDPILALGISDAFRDVELLVEALDKALSGLLSFDEALAGYERRRNEISRPLYEMSVQASRMESPSFEKLCLMQALSEDAEELTRYMGVLNGVVLASEFFAPKNIERILRKHAL